MSLANAPMPGRLAAVLGPTNTGKTHLAVERMLGHASGMIGLPLRLLAREVYDRIVRARGVAAVALITGEEKLLPPRPRYFVCTTEAMPLERSVEFLAVDEIQLVTDPERGHVFTHRLLNARGRLETLFLGSAAAAPLIRRLLGDVQIDGRARLSRLAWSGARKLSRLPRRSAVVAFSAEAVYAIGELIRRQHGGGAVVMGSLSPRTRNAQVALYQSGEVDFLVATDAIGMGLNMDLDHVAFARLEKFDGARVRPLTAQEAAQIAGRAGRFHADGTFGVTAGCAPLEPDVIEAVEAGRFEPLREAQWRNARLDFSSAVALLDSLTAPPERGGLARAAEQLDERTLRALVAEPAIAARLDQSRVVERLWQACQLPDFRRLGFEEHQRLTRVLFEALASPSGRLPESWMTAQFAAVDRSGGGIDALAQRLASVRTLSYIANRAGWLAEQERWREATRTLEDRLSDELHEGLMARFVDRRTSALVRGLAGGTALLAGVAADGAVTVEGQFVGRLEGLRFRPAEAAGALDRRMLRAAAERVVGPEIDRRLGRLAAEPDEAFTLQPDGLVLWHGAPVGAIAGAQPFKPVIRLLGETGGAMARQRAGRRLEAFVVAQAAERLPGLARLNGALASGRLRGLARGMVWRLIESGGVLARREVEADVGALSRRERRVLRQLGVRIGRFALSIADASAPEGRAFARPFAHAAAGGAPLIALGRAGAPPAALGLAGLVEAGGLLASVNSLAKLDRLLDAAPRREGGARLSAEDFAAIGWPPEVVDRIMAGLGFAARPGEGARLWRPRRRPRSSRSTRPDPASPFAALTQWAPPPAAAVRRHRRASGSSILAG